MFSRIFIKKGLHLRSFEESLSSNRMPVEQGGISGHENYINSRSISSLPLHLPPQQNAYGVEYARMEAWMDENPEFVQDYFIRKATRQVVDSWLVSHATPTANTEVSSPSHINSQNSSSRGGSGATTPVRYKISAHEFERGGLLKPIVNTVDGTPTFISPQFECDYLASQVSNGITCHLTGRPQRLSRNELKQLDEKELIFELVKDICNDLDVRSLCHKILQNVSILLNADRGSLFLVQKMNTSSIDNPVKCLVSKLFDVCPRSTVEEMETMDEVRVEWGSGIAGHVAESGEPVNIPDAYQDERFNKEIDILTGYRTKALLCMPIKDCSGDVIGVAQVINKYGGSHFTETDEKVFASYLQFCGIGLRNAQLYEKSQLEIKRNQVLLDLAKMIFEEQSTIEHMVFRILTHMQSLIQCQRVQILLVHEASKGSFSRVFDFEANDLRNDECDARTSPFESRFPINIGITGYVATTGETVNITNAYEDLRFDKSVDVGQLFKHKSILCMAIKNSLGQIIGVIQLINKFDNLNFTKNDENFVEAFAIFCGMGIHNTHMYEKAIVAMAKQSVTLEVLSYHASASMDDALRLKNHKVPSAAFFDLHDFKFDDIQLEDDDTLKACIRIFLDLDLVERFHIDYEVLCRWLLSVKKNYRNVTYHNFRHAFNVTQMMFAILTATQWWKVFGEIECLALVIGCLCHDLDHRGTNNSFQIKASSPLAQLYSTSTLEHHHYNQCIMILNSPGNQILSNLSSDDYCRVIRVLEDAILSTDLAVYFRKRGPFLNAIKSRETLDWRNEEPRSLLRAMSMTVCDLSAISKPWNIEKRVADLVSSEFFEQGDMERQELNITPIAFAELSDKLVPLVEQVRDNRMHWIQLAEETKKQRNKERENMESTVTQIPNNNNNNNFSSSNTFDEVSTSSSDVSISSKIVGKLTSDATLQILDKWYREMFWKLFSRKWRNKISQVSTFSFMIIHSLLWKYNYGLSTSHHQLNLISFSDGAANQVLSTQNIIEESLQTIHDIQINNIGKSCHIESYRSLKIPLNTEIFSGAREKADLVAVVLQDVGLGRHNGLMDALVKGLLSDPQVIGARALTTNLSSGAISSFVYWKKQVGTLNGLIRVDESDFVIGMKPDNSYPWFEDPISSPGLRSAKFAPSPPNMSFKGWWTYIYYSCSQKQWMLSYSVVISPGGRHGTRGFLSIDIDVSDLKVNQCENEYRKNDYFSVSDTQSSNSLYPQFSRNSYFKQNEDSFTIGVFHNTHKCHKSSMKCEYKPHLGKSSLTFSNWVRGAYQCICKTGYFSYKHPHGINGSIMEYAYQEYMENRSTLYTNEFVCLRCAPGCETCSGPEPCLASYNWPFRITLLTFSVICGVLTLALAIYMFQHRKVKVFKVASPIFLTITLLGCAIMYLEMAAIFPILDKYSCIATKWTRHMGFCLTYTALLMKTWRVSLTYRVKSAHKVKLTDKQLLQWMVPILLVMVIYLGTWTLSATPYADKITDQNGLIFKQCSYNWWDHSLAIGEVLFLAWGIRVCYNVRNAESMYNEARLISYAIYNIALVNTTMVAFHLLIFPQAGPDIKYLLGFIRTQLSTSVTVALVFGPKIIRVLRGQGDQWDKKSRFRGITASFSLNGVGLVADETTDLYQENEELKEEIQKLAAQIEFMKIVNMEVNNRHLKPKPGGFFTIQSPMGKSIGVQSHFKKNFKSDERDSKQESSVVTDDPQSGSQSGTSNSIG
uniref:Phosphodiesterase n=1 Tax=Culicoides sonorensis TaxID=179676 RepID=A0A336LQJ2_CULSO